MVTWLLTTRFVQDAPAITAPPLTKDQINTKYFKSNIDRWTLLRTAFSHPTSNFNVQFAHQFVWQNSPEQYHTMLKKFYLTPPHYTLRLVQFKGDLLARAEEYFFLQDPNSLEIYKTTHLLPESQKGALLSETEARSIAVNYLSEQYGLATNQIEEISAISTQHPNRKDWLFTYFIAHEYNLNEAQARINVTISGDQVTDSNRFIFVPEEWQRKQLNMKSFTDTIKVFSSLLLLVIILLSSIVGVLHWNKNKYSSKTIFIIAVTIFFLLFGEICNNISSLISEFNTSEPFINQLFQILSGSFVALLLRSVSIALVLCYTTQIYSLYYVSKNYTTYLVGSILGIIMVGSESLLKYILPSYHPVWANYLPLASFIPSLAIISYSLFQYIF